MEEVDETIILDQMPEGPDEDPVGEDSIRSVENLRGRLAREIDMKSAVRHRKSEGDGAADKPAADPPSA
jgi:hypothetical protein